METKKRQVTPEKYLFHIYLHLRRARFRADHGGDAAEPGAGAGAAGGRSEEANGDGEAAGCR